MSAQVRRVAVVVFVLFAALFANLNYLQVLQARALAQDPRNSRLLIAEYDRRRGAMLVGSGVQQSEVARSIETDDRLRYLREYPQGPLYAHVTGFYSFIYGRAALEQSFNPQLAGSAPENFGRNLGDLLAGQEPRGDDLRLTLVPAVQHAAATALGDRRGAVVALDPSTGAILAMVSSPTYNPNDLSSHDRTVVQNAWETTEANPLKPRLNRATSELFPPGSTFKLITTAAALAAGADASTTYEDPPSLDLPQTDAVIPNFGGGRCNGGAPITLAEALAVSCNTTFGQIGLQLGPEPLVAAAERFGLNRDVEAQLPVATSRIPKELDPPSTAQSAIGQRDVRVTPLQMAMVAAAIGNGGTLMTPRAVATVEDFAGREVRRFDPAPLVLPGASDAQALPPQDAAALRDMMVGVVESGSGGRAALPGVRVAGKTGTAQTADDGPLTVWFVAFAPAEAPTVAVAVVVEGVAGERADEATGGRIAAPIARAVLQAALTAPR